MRKYVFRAWNNKEAKMYYSDSVFPNCEIGFFANGWEMSLWSQGGEFLKMAASSKDKGNELMQFMWMKDKNGKELYEGDIVIPENINGSPPYIVIYRNDLFCIVGVDRDGNWLHIEELVNCEIIGNIYENPELIK